MRHHPQVIEIINWSGWFDRSQLLWLILWGGITWWLALLWIKRWFQINKDLEKVKMIYKEKIPIINSIYDKLFDMKLYTEAIVADYRWWDFDKGTMYYKEKWMENVNKWRLTHIWEIQDLIAKNRLFLTNEYIEKINNILNATSYLCSIELQNTDDNKLQENNVDSYKEVSMNIREAMEITKKEMFEIG